MADLLKDDVLKKHEGIIAFSRYSAFRTPQLEAILDLAIELEKLRREASVVDDSR